MISFKEKTNIRFTYKQYFFGCSVHGNLKVEAQAGRMEVWKHAIAEGCMRHVGSNCEDKRAGPIDFYIVVKKKTYWITKVRKRRNHKF